MAESATKIIIVDDHQIIIDGLKMLLSQDKEMIVLDEALNGQILLEKLKENLPDLVLMDIEMPVLNGIETSKQIKKLYPNVKILILSMSREKRYITKLIKIGIDGYASKNLDATELKLAIKTIMNGNTYYDNHITEIVMNSFKQKAPKNSNVLTDREKEITILIANGLSSSEIAEQLFLSPHTVETHRKNIFSKLGVKNIANLVRYAVQSDLVE